MVKLHTNLGDITLELDAEKRPTRSRIFSNTSKAAFTTTRFFTA